MLSAQIVVIQRPGLVLREDHHAPGSVCETIEHVAHLLPFSGIEFVTDPSADYTGRPFLIFRHDRDQLLSIYLDRKPTLLEWGPSSEVIVRARSDSGFRLLVWRRIPPWVGFGEE